jgi:hypothetical protein
VIKKENVFRTLSGILPQCGDYERVAKQSTIITPSLHHHREKAVKYCRLWKEIAEQRGGTTCWFLAFHGKKRYDTSL